MHAEYPPAKRNLENLFESRTKQEQTRDGSHDENMPKEERPERLFHKNAHKWEGGVISALRATEKRSKGRGETGEERKDDKAELSRSLNDLRKKVGGARTDLLGENIVKGTQNAFRYRAAS
ncbi:hypothetical protein BDZ97DRAFT_2062148 [Flammula alnicola]|nr:hypothetical protein BDZ97DRAFT_2062148 [Flammula alnicola]